MEIAGHPPRPLKPQAKRTLSSFGLFYFFPQKYVAMTKTNTNKGRHKQGTDIQRREVSPSL